MVRDLFKSHLHLHVMSSDLCGADMERFIQYNGFHPDVGLFVTIDQVLAWFDGPYSNYRKRRCTSPISDRRNILTRRIYLYRKSSCHLGQAYLQSIKGFSRVLEMSRGILQSGTYEKAPSGGMGTRKANICYKFEGMPRANNDAGNHDETTLLIEDLSLTEYVSQEGITRFIYIGSCVSL
jgi:hypothetical protein